MKSNLPPLPRLRLCIGFLLALVSGFSLRAVTYTWTGTGTDTNWTNADNWDANGPAVSGADIEIILAKSGAYTVTQNSGATLSFNRFVISSNSGAVTINTPNYFSTNAPTTDGFAEIELNNTNTSSWNNQLTLNRTLHFTGTGTGQLTFNAIVQGTQGIIVDASGILALTKANTFQGGLTVKRGTVTLTAAAAAGTGAITMEGGTLRNSTSAGAVMTELNQALNISGNFALGYSGTERGFTFTKPITITGTNALRTISIISKSKNTDMLILNGTIGDEGANNGLKLTSTGTVRFGGDTSNTYTGQTVLWGQNVNLVLQKTDGKTAIAKDLYVGHGTVTIQSGVQRVGGKLYSTDYATSDLQINSGATLAIAGETGLATRSLTTDSTGGAGTLLLENTATLHVSDYWTDQENGFSSGQRHAAAAALTWAGSLTLDGGATLNFDLTADPAASDGIFLTSESSVITFSDTTGLAPVTLNLTALDGITLSPGTTYTLLSVTGGFVNLNEQNLAQRLILNANGLEGTFALTANTLTFTTSAAIPEPTACVLVVACISTAAAWMLRRRQSLISVSRNDNA